MAGNPYEEGQIVKIVKGTELVRGVCGETLFVEKDVKVTIGAYDPNYNATRVIFDQPFAYKQKGSGKSKQEERYPSDPISDALFLYPKSRS